MVWEGLSWEGTGWRPGSRGKRRVKHGVWKIFRPWTAETTEFQHSMLGGVQLVRHFGTDVFCGGIATRRI